MCAVLVTRTRKATLLGCTLTMMLGLQHYRSGYCSRIVTLDTDNYLALTIESLFATRSSQCYQPESRDRSQVHVSHHCDSHDSYATLSKTLINHLAKNVCTVNGYQVGYFTTRLSCKAATGLSKCLSVTTSVTTIKCWSGLRSMEAHTSRTTYSDKPYHRRRRSAHRCHAMQVLVSISSGKLPPRFF